MSKNKYLFIFFLFTVHVVQAQSGYFGRKSAISLTADFIPSTRMVNSTSGFYNYSRMKIFNLTYLISLSKVISRRVEGICGFQYANVKFSSYSRFYSDEPAIFYNLIGGYQLRYSIIEEANGNYFGGYAGLNFYYSGSFAPIGKYMGFVISYGNTHVKDGESFTIGEREKLLTSGFLKIKYQLDNPQNIESVYFTDKLDVQTLALKFRIGQNYPVNQSIFICAGLTIPLFSLYFSPTKINNGYSLFESVNYNLSANKNWLEYTLRSIKPYHSLMVDIGVKFVF